MAGHYFKLFHIQLICYLPCHRMLKASWCFMERLFSSQFSRHPSGNQEKDHLGLEMPNCLDRKSVV